MVVDIQEIVDEITEKEPRGYLFDIPVYASKHILENEMLFLKFRKPYYPWMPRIPKERTLNDAK